MQATTVVDETNLWHKRLGHCNYPSLNQVSSVGLLDNLPKLSNKGSVCSACQFGKLSRKPYPPVSRNRARIKLELVHTDVAGPMKVESLVGSRFHLIFIDDMSRFCWIYFLKAKFEVFEMFLKFKAKVELETGCKIKTLRSDNGGEYTSNEFYEFLLSTGISHQLTTPYSPQQNGVSERKNRTILEMCRCLLFEKNLPKKF